MRPKPLSLAVGFLPKRLLSLAVCVGLIWAVDAADVPVHLSSIGSPGALTCDCTHSPLPPLVIGRASPRLPSARHFKPRDSPLAGPAAPDHLGINGRWNHRLWLSTCAASSRTIDAPAVRG